MVLEPKERKFCALNATSSLIWAKLQEAVSAEQLAKHIAASYQGIDEADALRDVRANHRRDDITWHRHAGGLVSRCSQPRKADAMTDLSIAQTIANDIARKSRCMSARHSR
jgi:hypothetical protein